ncbi:MAG: HAD-IA family hydrolase [Chitinispirillaceae bacterium]|nr:HAD-IA family hydrolase [Chitinispirillaceae bacterium]
MADALIFDFDGTIADTFDLSLHIGRNLLDSLHLRHVSEEEIVHFRNKPLRQAVRSFKIPLRKIPSLIIRIRREIHEHIDEIKPFDGMRDVLRAVKPHCAFMGMVTSNSEENVAHFLARFSMEFFDAGAYSSAILGKASKLRRLMRKNGLDPERVIYIGDTTDDVEACRKVGIRAAAVTWGYNTKEVLERSNPEYLFERVEDLLRLVSLS